MTTINVRTAVPRVLIVDDNTDAADMLSLLLMDCGCDVAVSYSGLAALEIADEFEPHLVFLDIGMPAMDGFETATRMRRTPWGRMAFIVALTALDDTATRHRIDETGINAHLVKPTTFQCLARILASARGHRFPGRNTYRTHGAT